VRVPNGTFYCFPDFSAHMKDSQELSHYLLEKVRVVTVPGKEFGFEGHLRLSYCGSATDISEGMDRIKKALESGPASELASGDRRLVRESA
jgi:aspartate aminotransferase